MGQTISQLQELLCWALRKEMVAVLSEGGIRCKLQLNLIQAAMSLAQLILRAKDAISMLGGRSAQQLDRFDEKFQEKPCSASGR